MKWTRKDVDLYKERLAEARFDFRHGIHSGIPRCCVSFYTFTQFFEGSDALIEHNKFTKVVERVYNREGADYVLCHTHVAMMANGWQPPKLHICKDWSDPICAERLLQRRKAMESWRGKQKPHTREARDVPTLEPNLELPRDREV